MSKVAIVFNNNQITTLLGNHFFSHSEKKIYLDLSVGELIDYDSLSKCGFKEISSDRNLLSDKEAFIKSYLDLVGAVGTANNTREWWATAVSSKGRNTSNLPKLLIQYFKSTSAIRNEQYDILLIISPEPNLFHPLCRLIEDEGQRVLSLRHYPEIFYLTSLLRLARDVFLIKQKVIRYLIHVCRVIKQSLDLAYKLSYTKKNIPIRLIKKLDKAKQYTVLKTHVYNNSFDDNGQFKDDFFGKLPSFLAEKRNVLSLVHIHGDHKLILRKISKNKNLIIIPYNYFLTYWDVLAALIKFLFLRIRIKTMYFNGVDVSSIIREEIQRTRFSLDQYLFYDSIKHFIKLFKVELFIYTYENIPWERMSILALRQFSPYTRIIGYQHSIVPQAHTGVFMSQSEIECAPMPDKILTVGEVTREIIYRYSEYKNSMVEAACALRYEYLFEHRSKKREKSGNILLVLEGNPIVYKMVNYVLGQLWKSDSYHLTIRFHPILPLQSIRCKIHYELGQSNKISISENTSILDDLTKSDVVIYWGTTLALEALSMGIPLIRYQMGNFLNYDPLFECNHLKWECSESDSLIDIIESIYKLSEEEFSEQVRQAKNYLSRYFHPVTDSNLNKFVYD